MKGSVIYAHVFNTPYNNANTGLIDLTITYHFGTTIIANARLVNNGTITLPESYVRVFRSVSVDTRSYIVIDTLSYYLDKWWLEIYNNGGDPSFYPCIVSSQFATQEELDAMTDIDVYTNPEWKDYFEAPSNRIRSSTVKVKSLSTPGWYRIIELYLREGQSLTDQGFRGSNPIHLNFVIFGNYNHTSPSIYDIEFTAVYQKYIMQVHSKTLNSNVLTELRYVFDSTNRKAYIDMYYAYSSSNGVGVYLKDSYFARNVKVLDTFVNVTTLPSTDTVLYSINVYKQTSDRNMYFFDNLGGKGSVEICCDDAILYKNEDRTTPIPYALLISVSSSAGQGTTFIFYRANFAPSTIAPLVTNSNFTITPSASDPSKITIASNASSAGGRIYGLLLNQYF